MAWPEFILLGHSMGAHVCYLYAACFKDRVRKLIVVESVGHVNRIEAGGDTAAMREFLDKRRKFDCECVERGLHHADRDKVVGATNVDPFKATTLYASVEDAARARMNGATKVSFNAAMALCERGLETVHVGDAVEKYRFSTDKRLFMRHFFRWDHEGVESILRSIESDILIVMGSASLIWNAENPVLQQRIKVLKDRNVGDAAAASGCKTRVEWIPSGTHHLHLEEDTVAAVADVLKKDWYDQDSYRLDELERLWFAWPEVYQEVFADYIAPLVEIQWTWEHTLTRLVEHPQIPKAMGKLINLTHLNLSHSNMSGQIPGELGNLKSLQVLRLWANSISGPIPPELGSLTQLRALELGKNKLKGPIPPELGNMESLQELQLSHNELSGPIPASLGNLKGLIRLEVQSNKLSGEIPPELGSLRCLTHLCLEKNQLSGSIPSEFGSLVSLWSMNLKWNQLTGSVPPELGNLLNLGKLLLRSNYLSGTLPPELGQCMNLTELDASSNNLTGAIPVQLSQCINLRIMNLSNNQFTGRVPVEFEMLQSLRKLRVAKNGKLRGPLPRKLKKAVKMKERFQLMMKRVL
ncbi:hypothetical protein HDU77_006485 [Chytriomyces hyalinus]|nr:hypothetical protein HDU77_006485 [Chytriomyces hyalinus]